jgi:hypothetical protein
MKAMRSASVPLATPTQCLAPLCAAKSFSNLVTSSPSMKWALSKTFFTAASISAFMGA